MSMMWFIMEHWMLLVAAIAAIASMLLVPPDGRYLTYIDWDTLGCLFCVLAVANAFRRIGLFDRVARLAVSRNGSPRTLSLAMVGVTAIFSMAFTNDVALIIMLPLSAAMYVELEESRLIPAVFSMQALAANLCGMITPFGSPQNLYLYTRYQLGLGEFFRAMAFPFAVSVVCILLATVLMTCVTTRTGTVGDASASDGADAVSPDSQRMQASPKMPLDSRRLTLYGILFVIALLAVFRAIPFWVAVAMIAIAILVADRNALREVDYALLATFACFFVFAGNVSRMQAVSDVLGPLMDNWGLIVSALTSQIISNVPAAVVLSHFSDAWAPLLVGVNIGGAGTFIGSLASLIVIRYFGLSRKVFPQMREPNAPTMARFLVMFGSINAAFFVVLLVLCQLVMSQWGL